MVGAESAVYKEVIFRETQIRLRAMRNVLDASGGAFGIAAPEIALVTLLSRSRPFCAEIMVYFE